MKYLIYSLLFTTLVYAQSEKAYYVQQPLWDDKLDLEEIEKQLKTEPIVKLKDMRAHLKDQDKGARYQNKVYLATLKNGLKAVFKPAGKHQDSHGEIGAYKASKWLGQRLVPPTVLKTHEGQKGSLQFFVTSPFDLLKQNDRDKAFSLLSTKAKSDKEIFYIVFRGGRSSTNPANTIIALDKQGQAHIAIIDNSATMRGKSKKEGAKVQYPKVYSKATLQRYKELDLAALKGIFKDALKDKNPLCTPSFFSTILARKDAVLAAAQKKKSRIP